MPKKPDKTKSLVKSLRRISREMFRGMRPGRAIDHKHGDKTYSRKVKHKNRANDDGWHNTLTGVSIGPRIPVERPHGSGEDRR